MIWIAKKIARFWGGPESPEGHREKMEARAAVIATIFWIVWLGFLIVKKDITTITLWFVPGFLGLVVAPWIRVLYLISEKQSDPYSAPHILYEDIEKPPRDPNLPFIDNDEEIPF